MAAGERTIAELTTRWPPEGPRANKRRAGGPRPRMAGPQVKRPPLATDDQPKRSASVTFLLQSSLLVSLLLAAKLPLASLSSLKQHQAEGGHLQPSDQRPLAAQLRRHLNHQLHHHHHHQQHHPHQHHHHQQQHLLNQLAHALDDQHRQQMLPLRAGFEQPQVGWLEHQHPAASHWTTGEGLLPSANAPQGTSGGDPVPDESAPQLVRDQPAGQQVASTTPTLNRQLPAPLYEIGLAPANALQLETSGADEAGQPRSTPSMGQQQLLQQVVVPDTGRQQQPATRTRSGKQVADLQVRDSSQASAGDPASQEEPQKATPGEASLQQVDKIEARQKRRMFNRILKKAEWNHLFVELSKVFLRYFLDLALKDIIGKQSGVGSGASSSTSDATSGRKKLDAQSELADLLRDFVKTAISNI